MRKNLLKSLYNPPPEFIGSVETGDVNGNWSITVSSLDIQAGDVGILMHTSGGLDAYSVSPSVTAIYQSGDGNPYSNVFARTMDGTETTFSSSGGTTLVANTVIFALFRNVVKPTTAERTAASGGSGTPNPPSHTFNAGDMIVCTGHHNLQLLTGITQSGFTMIEQINQANAPYYTTSMMSYKQSADGGAENPPGFVTSPPGSSSWDAVTIQLEPA